MNMVQLMKLIQRKDLTRRDLIDLLNSERKTGAVDRVELIEAELDVRFPGWDKTSGSAGIMDPDAKSTHARLYGEIRQFPRAVSAYAWLVDRLMQKANVGATLDPTLLAKINTGTSRKYIARSPGDLYPNNQKLASNPVNWRKLSYGWHLATNLSNREKLDILARMMPAFGVKPNEWDCQFPGEEYQSLEDLLAPYWKEAESLSGIPEEGKTLSRNSKSCGSSNTSDTPVDS